MVLNWDTPYSLIDLLDATAHAPAEPLVRNLIPFVGTVLLHGQPRDGKSLVALELCLALATGTSAFGSPRLDVPGPTPVLYVAAEDDVVVLAERLRGMLRARSIGKAPDTLQVMFPRDFSFDQDDPLQELAEDCITDGVRFVVFDPVRRLTKGADQGPSEFQPVAKRLLDFRRKTRAVVALVHHDLKPDRRSRDRRQLPHLASGGGIFAACEAPIHIERLTGNRIQLTPAAYKFSADPDRFIVQVVIEEVGGEQTVRLTEAVSRVHSREPDLKEGILRFLALGPAPSGSRVAQALNANKENVLNALAELKREGKVQSSQHGRATMWALTSRS